MDTEEVYSALKDHSIWGTNARYYLRISEETYNYIANKFLAGLDTTHDGTFDKTIWIQSKDKKILIFQLKTSSIAYRSPLEWPGDRAEPGCYYILAANSSIAHTFFYWAMKEKNKVLDTKHTLDII